MNWTNFIRRNPFLIFIGSFFFKILTVQSESVFLCIIIFCIVTEPMVNIVNQQQPVGDKIKKEEPPASGQTVVVEGLDSGTVIGIAFAAFIIGVLLVAALWFIHTHTGQFAFTFQCSI